MTYYYTTQFAAAYGEGAYGTSVYSCTNASDPACTTTTGTSGAGTAANGSGSGLANTGTLVVLFASIACLIIFVAFVVRIWRRKPALQTVQASVDADAQKHDVRQ